MTRRNPLGWLLLTLLGAASFVWATQTLRRVPRGDVAVEMQVSLPLFVQVAMAGGDRYLAANFDAFRALVVSTPRMRKGEYDILARVQTDASWLNPAHEDNYYIAAAVLPWNGQVIAAQQILSRASAARPTDFQPAFFFAFDRLYFEGDAEGASAYLREAAEHVPDPDIKLTMQNYAVRWLDRSRDLDNAILVVEAMAKHTRRKDFRGYLQMRAERLKSLLELRKAADRYRDTKGAAPRRLEDLVDGGQIVALPKDPFGFGFSLDANGRPILLNQSKAP